MGYPVPKKEHYSIKEYLEYDNHAEVKHEYEKGLILVMPGGTVPHSMISSNLQFALRKALPGGCIPFGSDTRVYISDAESFVYPDTSVICGEIEYFDEKKNGITNPILIAEVLSESTEGYDRSEKFDKYRAIPTFKEYVLVKQDRIRIDVFVLQEDGSWKLRTYSDENGFLPLASLGIEIPVHEVYENVPDLK